MSYWVYILHSASLGRYYIGHSEYPFLRLERDHNGGRSSSTKAGRPWGLVHIEQYRTRSEAMAREGEIKKKKSRRYIEWLIE